MGEWEERKRQYAAYREVARDVMRRFVERGIVGTCYVVGLPPLVTQLYVRYQSAYSFCDGEFTMRPMGKGEWQMAEGHAREAVMCGGIDDVVEYVSLRAIHGFHPTPGGGQLVAEQVDAVAHHPFVERVLVSPQTCEDVVAVGADGSVCALDGTLGGDVYRSVREFVSVYCETNPSYPCGEFWIGGADEMVPLVFADRIVHEWRNCLGGAA